MRSEELVLWQGFRILLTWLNDIYAFWTGSTVPVPPRCTFLKFIFWHYKDGYSLTMEMIFSLHNGSQSLLWAKAQSLKVVWVFPSLSNSSPAQWRNESPRLLKGPTCQRSRGISHSQPTYCSPDHNRPHRAQPFVIKSVVNFCWGNKSLTHLQLWIKTFLPFFFLLSCPFLFFLWHIACGDAGHIKSHSSDTHLRGQHPQQWWTRFAVNNIFIVLSSWWWKDVYR